MNEQQVIVIKKSKRGHGGHHGGAWKVAYADFITAMMAFFLVMWLVGQSKAVKAAVGAYFRDPGVFETQAALGLFDQNGTPGPVRSDDEAQQALERAADRINRQLMDSPEFAALRQLVEIRVTSGGLRIELTESSEEGFFDSGSAALKSKGTQLLATIAQELGSLNATIAVEGHTDSRPYSNAAIYSNWELSTERANAARRIMSQNGLKPHQLEEIRGYADTQLRLPDDPTNPSNRRVSIVVRNLQDRSALPPTIQEQQVTPVGLPAPPVPTSEVTPPRH